MEPAFQRGDLIFLSNPSYEQYKTGDIIVYKVPNSEIPIVHRILETHDAPQRSKSKSKSNDSSERALVGDQLILTKGDNNPVDDLELYKGLTWLQRKHVVGKVRG